MIKDQNIFDKIDDLKSAAMLLRGLGRIANEMGEHPDMDKAFYCLVEKLETATGELENILSETGGKQP